MTITNTQLTGTSKKDRSRTLTPADTRVAIGSPTAIKFSELLRRANIQKRSRMIEQLIRAGVEQIDGWTIAQLLEGKLNRSTGDRVLPDGTINNSRIDDPASGRYWGSRTHMPVTSLNQRGVVWSSAS